MTRSIAGVLVLLVGLTFLLESMIGAIPVAVGGYLIATGVVGFCPIVRTLGVDGSSRS